MKLPLLFCVFAIAGFTASAAVAGQQSGDVGREQKARPDPVLLMVVADAGSTVAPTATSQQKYDAAFSVCQAVVPTTHRDFAVANYVGPDTSVSYYFLSRGISFDAMGPSIVVVSEQPQHGKLLLNSDGYYVYYPNEGYLGPDQITFVVEQMGKKFKVIETVWVANTAPEYGGCPADYKLPPATTGNEKGSALDVIELPVDGTLDTDALAKLHAFVSFAAGAGLAGVGGTLNVADLQGAAIGQTTGTSITLDANAAGNGWFIDPTPGQNEEWLPTSNPNEWVAKAGSTAAGKMDMLSVLLHEYGHALGINHSADPNDFMGTTLTAGVRRLPSAEEMALMQSLVAEAKATLSPSPSPANGGGEFPTLPLGTSFIGFLGLLRSSRYGGVSIAPDASTLVTQYDWAANATLTNGSLNAADGWSTQGSVNIGNGAAVMNEVSGSQTRLSQVFLLNPTDRFLSFTLSGTALDNLTGAPDDAFEVALLDANTGASLLSGTGQTRTDAFLNLQADGTQNLANCVTCINNADGSRTYRVDLAGVPAGVAANLSFDLIGFGQNNSHITVSDVRLSGLPQLHDEAATMLEDGTLAFNPFAQVDNAAVLQLGSHVVDQPAHGAVTVNADGTFSYTPAADYFGTDSFTYRLSDGPLESNLATVSITLTAVNDAPVVADVQATTAEDTALVIALGAYATDVDSTTLTTQIVTGPAHGVLTQNADGSYTYTPAANYNGVDSFTYQANDGALDSNIATVSLNVTAVNDAPTLGDLNLAAVEDTALTINPLAQATDIDGDALTASIVATSQHGQLTVNADGSFTYSPDLNFNGVDSFTYKVNDGHADSNIATVTLAVAAVNDAPVAADAAVTTAEDTALVIDLRTYATDVDSTTFTASIFTGPTHGVLTQNADGSYTYTPTANYNGADSFTYLVNDGSADSNIATVTLAITAVNDAPTLGDLNLAGVEDTALAMNLLAAASDVDGDLLTASIVAGPLHGQVSINADGSFTYTPELNFNGADSFTYKANDGSLDSNIATVLLTIAAVNDAPVAADATVTTLEDTSLVVDLRTYATDVDSTVVTAQIVNGPAHGTLVANADGTFTYTPDANYNGADSFTYLVNDGALDSNIATVTLGITAVNDAPVATDLQISGFEDTPLNLNLLVGATDVDGDALSPILIAAPLHGRLITNADNTISYVPELNYFGTDSFTYKVTDGSLDSNIVTVTLDIAAVNDAPVALSAMVAGLEDTPYIFAWNDFRVSDVDAAGLGITINTLPASGMLQCFNGLEWVAVAAGQRFAQGEIDAGWLCFGPDVNESGFEGYAAGGPSTELRTGFGNMKANYASFTYQADDGLLSSAIASMTVNILPVADAPSIALNAAAGESGASAIRFATGWESVSNRNNKYTLVSGHSLEGWRVVREHELGDGYHRDRDHDGHYDEHDHCDDNKEAFVIWSNGDRMKDANDDKRIVYGAQGPLPQEGEGTRCHHRPTGNWLELGNAMDLERQAYGMERTVTTRAGIAYDLRYCIASIAGPLRLPCFG